MLSPQVREYADRSIICWLATVDEIGQPTVSPKEIFAVFDASHLVIANIASPGSVRNIKVNPRVCLSFIDIFVQKGFKVLGTARNVLRGDADYEHWSPQLVTKAGPRFPIQSVIVIKAMAVEPILAPSYQLYSAEVTEQSQAESAMRAYGVRASRESDA
jgi:uncharacterized protein